MHTRWPLATFVAGSLAIPSNEWRRNQERGLRRIQAQQWSNDTLSYSTSQIPSTSSLEAAYPSTNSTTSAAVTTSSVVAAISTSLSAPSDSSTVIDVTSEATVYETVHVTVNTCSPSPTLSVLASSSSPISPAEASITLSTTSSSLATSSSVSSFSWATGNWSTSPTTTPDSSCALPTSPLTNEEQVGNSTLGTLCQQPLPQWLGDYPSAPWGDRTTTNSHAANLTEIPVTNVTRYYNFSISRSRISADGVLRDVILINDQFPGPLIEANWGDWISVTVNNEIEEPQEGTSLHWHGQLQKETPWYDGTPGASQCPIAPGHSFTYTFQAEQYGTSWYHAHYSAQFTAGVNGPMAIHGPTQLPYDIDIGPVMLSDWYHIPYFSIVADAVGTNFSLIPPVSDSGLINGRGRFDCSDASYDSSSALLASNLESNITWTCVDNAPLSQFRFQSGKTHRLRLMNHGANGVQKFSIDGHIMTVIATDYIPTVPYNTDVVTLGVGQRTDVLVTASSDPTTAVWMRAELPGGEPCGGSNNPLTLAAVYYEDADTSVEPTTVSSVVYNNDTLCWNDPLTETIPMAPVAPQPVNETFIQDLSLSLVLNATGEFEFQINGQAWHADFNVPILANAAAGNYSFAPQWNVYDFQNNASMILNITNNMPLTHPFHLHGHNFYVLDVDGPADGVAPTSAGGAHGGPQFGNGQTWDGTVINAATPMRRDTILIPPYGYAAIQFDLDNPGVWPFHCHVAWHLSGGQGMNILYKADEILPIPAGMMEDTCVDWNYFSNNNVVDQIDSGS